MRDLFDFIQLSYLCSRNPSFSRCPPEHLTLLMDDLYYTMCYHEVGEWEMVANQMQRLGPECHSERSAAEENDYLFSLILEATKLHMDERIQNIWNIGQVPAAASPKYQYGIPQPQEPTFPPPPPNWPYREPWVDKKRPDVSVGNPDSLSHRPPAPPHGLSSTGGQGHSKRIENTYQNRGSGQPLVTLAPISCYRSTQACPGISL